MSRKVDGILVHVLAHKKIIMEKSEISGKGKRKYMPFPFGNEN